MYACQAYTFGKVKALAPCYPAREASPPIVAARMYACQAYTFGNVKALAPCRRPPGVAALTRCRLSIMVAQTYV